jgi:hypothetical protein
MLVCIKTGIAQGNGNQGDSIAAGVVNPGRLTVGICGNGRNSRISDKMGCRHVAK